MHAWKAATRSIAKRFNSRPVALGLMQSADAHDQTARPILPQRDDANKEKVFLESRASGRLSSKWLNMSEHQEWPSLVGQTPLVRLKKLCTNPLATVLVKCEFFNPSNSIKDRMVEYVIGRAELAGKLTPHQGQMIVAGSSGNTGAALAMYAAMHGYKAVVVTSKKTSQEKIDALRVFGAEVIVKPSGLPATDPNHYTNFAQRLATERGAFDIDQYNNPANPEAYYHTLGPEVWEQTKGSVDVFVAGGSTGGTVTGVGRYLKEVSKGRVHVMMPDPVGSCLYSAFKTGAPDKPGPFKVEGVGKDSVPRAWDPSIVDEMIQIEEADIYRTCRRLCSEEGICAGGSSGLNVFAALKFAGRVTQPTTIVAIMPDSGMKYLSKIYSDEWMTKHGFM